MVTDAIYRTLLVTNLLVIAASFWLGPKMLLPCRIAALLTAIALGVMVVPLVSLLMTTNPPEGRWLAVKILLGAITPLLVEFIMLVMIYRKCVRAR